MWIMAAAAARLSGVENVRVQTNVRTSGCSGFKHITDQDKIDRPKQKLRSVGRNWSFYLWLCHMQNDNHLFCRLSSQSSAIPSPAIPSILEVQLNTVEQQNKDRTARHSVSIRLYSNPSCAIIVTYLPIKFQKVVWTRSSHIRCALNSFPPDVWTCLNTSNNQVTTPQSLLLSSCSPWLSQCPWDKSYRALSSVALFPVFVPHVSDIMPWCHWP